MDNTHSGKTLSSTLYELELCELQKMLLLRVYETMKNEELLRWQQKIQVGPQPASCTSFYFKKKKKRRKKCPRHMHSILKRD